MWLFGKKQPKSPDVKEKESKPISDDGIASDIDVLKGKEKWDSLSTSIIKTTEIDEYENRQNNLENISEGDILSADYLDSEEIYMVSDECGNELGELSKAISAKILEKEESGFEILPVVDETTENDSGILGANITLYFKPAK